MAPRTESGKTFRLSRDSGYRRRVIVATALSVMTHVIAIVILAPFRESIPLVRHIGYRGPTQILPEISVIREIGPSERENLIARGEGGQNVFRVVPITVTDWEVPAGETESSEIGDKTDDVAEDGLDVLRELEMSLPQPRSQDMVVAHLVKPRYPATSRVNGVEGVVVFRLHVTKTGDVANIWLLRSEVDRACEQAARRALFQWKYRPYIVDGEAVDFLGDQPVRFRMTDLEAATGGVRVRSPQAP